MTLGRYIIGFVLSLLLTVTAYTIVMHGGANPWLIIVISILALIQMVVQLIFFLHLGDEVGPRYKLMSFLFMAGTLLIVVGGSVWIMNNLNYNMMQLTPSQKDNYMSKENEMGF